MMGIKHLLSFFSSILILLSTSGCSKSAPDEFWIAIRFAHQGVGQANGEYYGKVEKKAFDSMLSATAPTGFLKLNNVAWMDDYGKIIPLPETTGTYAKYGYGCIMYLRTETIARIIVLDEKFVQQNLEHSEKK